MPMPTVPGRASARPPLPAAATPRTGSSGRRWGNRALDLAAVGHLAGGIDRGLAGGHMDELVRHRPAFPRLRTDEEERLNGAAGSVLLRLAGRRSAALLFPHAATKVRIGRFLPCFD